MQPSTFIVCGDIGGTNARLQLWSVSDGLLSKLNTQNYRMAEFHDLVSVLKKFLGHCKQEIHICALAVCGVVWENGRRNDPNNLFHPDGTQWPIQKAEEVEKGLGLKEGAFLFVNDFESIGQGIAIMYDVAPALVACKHEISSSVQTLYSTISEKGKPIACLGAGTGLGAVYLTCTPENQDKYLVHPSEAGMCCSFSPENELEWNLKHYLIKKYGKYIEVERVVSGNGLVNIFQFLLQYRTEQGNPKSAAEQEVEAADQDHRAVIIEDYAKKGDPICLAAVDLFLDVYARVTGLVAITFLPYAGLYIAGGILPKVLWRAMEPIEPSSPHGRFVSRYLDMGTMTDTVKRIPLYLISGCEIGTWGSLYCGLNLSKTFK